MNKKAGGKKKGNQPANQPVANGHKIELLNRCRELRYAEERYVSILDRGTPVASDQTAISANALEKWRSNTGTAC